MSDQPPVIGPEFRPSLMHKNGLWYCPGCGAGYHDPGQVGSPVWHDRPDGTKVAALACPMCRDKYEPRA